MLFDRWRRQRIVVAGAEQFDVVATCTGWTASIDGTSARQVKNSAALRA
jgi:hypothetical protein